MGAVHCYYCHSIMPEGGMVCVNCEENFEMRDEIVREVQVKLNEVSDISEFISLCSKCPGDVTVYSGRYVINGKSMMGLFSVDLTKPLKVEFCGDIPDEVKVGMKKFIMN